MFAGNAYLNIVYQKSCIKSVYKSRVVIPLYWVS